MIDLMGKRFGIPWHGLWTRLAAYPNTETFLSPSGSTIFPPEPLGSNVGGCSWEVNAGAPAVSLTSEEMAAENAAGRTWLNYGILYGTPDRIRMGGRTLTGPLYIDPNGTPWMLEAASGQLRFTRFGLFNNAPVAVTQSLSLPADASEIHNFSRDGRKIAFKKLNAPPYGFTVYTISGIPPAAALSLEASYLADQYVNVSYSGGPQMFQAFGMTGNDTVGWTLADTFTGDPNSETYYDWVYSWPRAMQGPVGASKVTHNDYTEPIGVMFADNGTTLPVIAHWHQDVQTQWCGAWAWGTYFSPLINCLRGSNVVSDSGYYEITIGGTPRATVNWTASRAQTFLPWTEVDQTVTVLGKSYHDAYTLSTWNPTGFYNPDLIQGGYAHGITAATYYAVFPDVANSNNKGLRSQSCAIDPRMPTNFVVAIQTGNLANARLRFGWRDGTLLSDDLNDIPMPTSNAYACSMHPVTHQFARLAGATDVVFL